MSAAGGTPKQRKQPTAAPTGSSADSTVLLTPLRELQLVQAYRDGDAEAARALLEAYQRRIYGVCYRMLRDGEAAADLTQDAMIKVLEGLASYDGRSQLSTWVIRVTMNCCLSHLRKERLRRHQPLADNEAEQGADAGGAPASPRREHSGLSRVEESERSQAVFAALAELEPETRALLVLRDVQGMEYQQIAEALELPLGTVKSRLFRAREALRSALEHRGL